MVSILIIDFNIDIVYVYVVHTIVHPSLTDLFKVNTPSTI